MTPLPATIVADWEQEIHDAILQLNEVLAKENAALKACDYANLHKSTQLKKSAVARIDGLVTLYGIQMNVGLASSVSRTKDALSENMSLLVFHMKAIDEIGQLINSAIMSAEDDGTYTRCRKTSGDKF
jgi:hypothetical protein